MKKVFIDTDIIFDLFLERYPYFVSSSLLFEMAEKGKISLYVSSLCFTNLFYIIRRKFSHHQTIVFLRKLASIATIISVGEEIINNSIDSDFSDLEDAVQYYSAIGNKVDIILTRNTKDYKVEDVTVMTAEEFLKTL